MPIFDPDAKDRERLIAPPTCADCGQKIADVGAATKGYYTSNVGFFICKECSERRPKKAGAEGC